MKYNFASRFDGVKGSAIRNMFRYMADPQIISFAGGNPSSVTFPKEALSELSQEIIATGSKSVLQYGNTVGVEDLLEQVQGLLVSEGLSPKLSELIILTGSTQGIDLMCKVMLNPGDTMLCEAPTFLGALQTFKLYEANVVGVDMDEYGMDLQDLEAKIKKYSPKFVYTIPTFQNPTGRTLPVERRKAVAELAEKYGTLILEDDPYFALRFEGDFVPSIKSFDKSGMVVKLMSFSKTISPGLRVGAAFGDEQIIDKFRLGKQSQDVHTSNLNQEMVARYLKSGAYPGRVEKNRLLYKEKMNLMYNLAKECFPKEARIVKPEGGMFMWVELPENMNATELLPKAIENKVLYIAGTHFYYDGGHDNTLRLNFTMADETSIEKGIKILGKVFSE